MSNTPHLCTGTRALLLAEMDIQFRREIACTYSRCDSTCTASIKTASSSAQNFKLTFKKWLSAELIAETEDMTFEDLFKDDRKGQSSNNSPRSSCAESQKRPATESTDLHEICRKGSVADLVRHLQAPPVLQPRMTSERMKYVVNIVPTEEVSARNPEGQVPLHLAAMNRKLVQETDGMKNRIEAIDQPAPGLVTALVTGRNPQNGQKLFEVQCDHLKRCHMCMQQDSLGMTSLHVAAMSDSSAALEVVSTLLEANPHAASVHDMDGLLPLDLACRNPARGSSHIVRVH